MATTYNTAIRQQLNKSGINNSRIGFANGYVTVDGKNFIQPTTTTNGTAYTSSSAFNNALKNVTTAANNAATTGNKLSSAASTASTIAKSLSVPSQSGKTTTTSTAIQTAPTAAWAPPVSQTQQTLNQIAQQLAKQQQTQFKAPEAFSYNAESDPAYQAQLALAKQNIARQQLDTNAALRASGQGKSSYSETVANQIGTDALSTLANSIVPQLMSQAYQQYNDTANRDLQIQQANYATGQDSLNNLQNLYGLQDKEYFQNPLAESQVTGTLQTAPVRDAINQLVSIKQQAEAKGITKDARNSLSETANQIRTYLKSQGVDTSALGANTASGKIDVANTGVRTLQGQQLDQQAAQNRFNQAIAVGDQTGRVITPQMDASGLFRQAANANTPLNLAGQQQAFNQAYQTNRANASDQQFQQQFGYQQQRDTVADNQWQQQFQYTALRAQIADGQWQQQFDKDVQQFGLNYALQQQIQNGQLSIQDAENARAQAKFDAEQAASGQVNINEIAAKYLDPVIQIDKNTGVPIDKEAAKRQIASIAGSDANLAAQLYLRYGMKPDFDYSPQ